MPKTPKKLAEKLEFLENFGVLEYFGVFSVRAGEVEIG